MTSEEKLKRLKRIILRMESLVLAFSGGLDSTLLLKVSASLLPKDKLLAVTANSPVYPQSELKFSRRMAESLGVRHEIINTHELRNRRFVVNRPGRCYECKKGLFRRLRQIAKAQGLNFVADGSNVTDKSDFRPGSKAKQEEGVRSPLQEAGLTKADIRILSKKLRLGTWNKPAMACLASRVPYGVRLKPCLLSRIEAAEEFLKRLGFKEVRVRHYNGLCRIEVAKGSLPALIRKRKAIAGRLRALGYRYITADLEGYRTGSLNESTGK